MGKLEEAIDVVETYCDNRGDTTLSKSMLLHLLQTSSKKKDIRSGRRIHFLVIKTRLDSSSLQLMDHLIRMFTLCGSLRDANEAFGQVLNPSIYTWQAIISAHVSLGKSSTALELFCSMQEQGHLANGYVFSCILKICHKYEDVGLFHHAIISMSLETDIRIGTSLMHMYMKCGSIEEACCIFDKKQYNKNVVSWGVMIAGCIEHGRVAKALWLFEHMMNKVGKAPDQAIFLSILRACGQIEDTVSGKLMHVMIVELMIGVKIVITNCLIDMYAKCGSIMDAENLFNSLQHKDIVSWGSLIGGYAIQGNTHVAILCFKEMQLQGMKPNKMIILNVLKACGGSGGINIVEVRSIHDQIIRSELEAELAIGNTLMDMYAKCGSLSEALEVFHALQARDVVSWSAMMRAYNAECGLSSKVFDFFFEMEAAGIEPDAVTFSCVLKACAFSRAISKGRLLHERIIRAGFDSNTVVINALLDMYMKCNSLEEASRVFDIQTNHDSISWAIMIGGYANVDGHSANALDLFTTMGVGMLPGNVSFLSVLKACSNLDSARQVNLIHDQIVRAGLEGDISISNSLIDTFAKIGALSEARKVFNQISDLSVVSWGAMITGYVIHGHDFAALQLFEKMDENGGFEPNHVIFLSAIKACSNIGAMDRGKTIHSDIIRCGLLESEDAGIGSSLVDMYAKCENVEDAYKVFTQLSIQNEAAWVAILTAYASHIGEDNRRVHQLLREMQARGVKPNGQILMAILNAFSHVGRVEEGCIYFTSMIDEYGIIPSIEHYTCMIDLLARVGWLGEAKCVLHSAPMPSDISGWVALLNACMLYNNMEIAKQCFHEVARLDPNHKSKLCADNSSCESYGTWHWSSFQEHSFERMNVVNGIPFSMDFDSLVNSHLSSKFEMNVLVEETNMHFKTEPPSFDPNR